MATISDGTLVQPNLHYQTDLSFIGDEPDPDDVAAGIWGVWGTQFLACCWSGITVHELVVTEEVLKPNIGAGGSHTVNAPGTLATGTGNSPPPGVCGVINLHTATRSRRSRGWVHGPPMAYSSFVNGKALTGAYLTALQTWAALLDNSFDLGTVDITHVHPVVYSRTQREQALTPYTFRVTAASVNTVPKYLRSRMTAP